MANEWSRLKKIAGHKGFYVSEKSQVIYWRGRMRGRSLKISTGETQISKAKKFVEEYQLSLTEKNIEKAKREKRGIKNPSIASIWEEILKERLPQRTDTTAVRYDTAWRMDLEPFLKDKFVSDVSESFVKEFENWFLETRPKKVFATAHKYMSMLLNYLHREGYVQKKLKVTNLDKINKNKRKKPFRVYSKEEQEALLKNAVNDRTALALLCYLDTGARKMEILSRKWSEFNVDKRILTIWSQKNKEWRDVPLTDRLFQALKQAYKKNIGEEYIFPNRSGAGFIPSQLFDKDWAKTKKLAGVKGRARVHDIRHTFATKTSNDKWPIAVACDMLDMSADVYMDTYVHVTIEDKKEYVLRSFGS